MKYLLFFLFLLFTCYLQAQEIPLNTNTIEVKGITFKEAVNRLLDSNYSINKIDSNFQLVETSSKKITGTNMSMLIKVRIKDSAAIITGLFGYYGEKKDQREGSIAWLAAGIDSPIANIKQWQKRKYTPFKVLNNYALSFGKPVEYKVEN